MQVYDFLYSESVLVYFYGDCNQSQLGTNLKFSSMEEKEESSNISMLLTDLDSDILEVSSEGRWGVF